MKPLLIGIVGGSASGKTTIAQCLKEEFEQTRSVVIIREDDYYKDQSEKTMAERVKTNYDHPFAFDHALMIEQIDALLAGQAIEKPVYDFVQHTRSTLTEVVEPCDVVVLEGLFVLEEPELRKRLNIKVYVDTDADIRFIRRLMRDVEERGRTLQSVVNQYTETVRVMHEQFIEPSKRYADVIIPEGGSNVVAIDLLKTKISSIISPNML
ncbi:uridine kinase [Holdemania massiliensis]